MQGIGVAGCGRMGGPMLAALRRAGFDAQGFDVRPAADFPGLPVTNDAATFAKPLKTLITVVRDADQTDDVLFGATGFAQAPLLETIVISSTLSPRYVRGLRARIPAQIALVDAPMSGAAIAAQEARLSFMLGGAEDDLNRLQPLFAAMGQHFHRMGGFGDGMAAKVLNNLLAATNTAMTRMVLDWADAQGIDEKRLLALIQTSSGQNWLASGFDTIEFARDGHDPENTIGILVKDVAAALDAAPKDADLTLPQTVQNALKTLRPRKAYSVSTLT
ncbi:NAD(P)-dependent oxidoreductase [Pseudorhodobacter wandonensis]|uniref:NAD(P)-dependent oxidoreductase n=1 Tax=Pseudorhodobacter wandonensis TaxID=1120568 RepID=UPI00067C4F84|nr:NAD(P)-binding domain-containing protein [Pseudorhodobacter wandonensis]